MQLLHSPIPSGRGTTTRAKPQPWSGRADLILHARIFRQPWGGGAILSNCLDCWCEIGTEKHSSAGSTGGWVAEKLHILQVNTDDLSGGAQKVALGLFQTYRGLGHASWL